MFIVEIYLWLDTTKYFVIRNFRGTCSSVGILKGYIVRERLGIPGLAEPIHLGLKWKQQASITFSTILVENKKYLLLVFFVQRVQLKMNTSLVPASEADPRTDFDVTNCLRVTKQRQKQQHMLVGHWHEFADVQLHRSSGAFNHSPLYWRGCSLSIACSRARTLRAAWDLSETGSSVRASCDRPPEKRERHANSLTNTQGSCCNCWCNYQHNQSCKRASFLSPNPAWARNHKPKPGLRRHLFLKPGLGPKAKFTKWVKDMCNCGVSVA